MIFNAKILAVIFCGLVSMPVLSVGAETLSRGAQGIINAERAFARLAAETNTREAFLTYLTDESITFGQGPHKGKARTRERPADDELLEWEPAFVDVAASGDFGYDLGPWKFRGHRADAEPIAWGTFVTVWKKQPDNTWRVALDLGTSHRPESARAVVTPATSAIDPKQMPVMAKSDFHAELLAAERTFISRFAQTGMDAYASVLSSEARLYRPGLMPACTPAAINSTFKTGPAGARAIYELLDGEIASSGDLGYVYGWVTTETTATEKTETKRSNYLRIWKRENGREWKLMLDLIVAN
jgi:ketosteroid isomerase-like protein